MNIVMNNGVVGKERYISLGVWRMFITLVGCRCRNRTYIVGVKDRCTNHCAKRQYRHIPRSSRNIKEKEHGHE